MLNVNPDTFRSTYLYTEPVDVFFQFCETPLMDVYKFASEAIDDLQLDQHNYRKNKKKSKHFKISCSDWCAFLAQQTSGIDSS